MIGTSESLVIHNSSCSRPGPALAEEQLLLRASGVLKRMTEYSFGDMPTHMEYTRVLSEYKNYDIKSF